MDVEGGLGKDVRTEMVRQQPEMGENARIYWTQAECILSGSLKIFVVPMLTTGSNSPCLHIYGNCICSDSLWSRCGVCRYSEGSEQDYLTLGLFT